MLDLQARDYNVKVAISHALAQVRQRAPPPVGAGGLQPCSPCKGAVLGCRPAAACQPGCLPTGPTDARPCQVPFDLCAHVLCRVNGACATTTLRHCIMQSVKLAVYDPKSTSSEGT